MAARGHSPSPSDERTARVLHTPMRVRGATAYDGPEDDLKQTPAVPPSVSIDADQQGQRRDVENENKSSAAQSRENLMAHVAGGGTDAKQTARDNEEEVHDIEDI